jgi:polyisoprenoid-binding protein YceI
MKNILLFVTLVLITGTMNAQNRLIADNEKTTLHWLGEKVLGEHNGTVKLQDGWLSWEDDRITAGEFIIDMASIKDDEGNANLEKHLKSDDFFGVEQYPTSELVITESTPFDKGTGVVKGNLTIKGITNPIEFKAAMQKKDDGTWFFASIVVDRTKYNVRYGSGSFFDNLGDKTIYDEFKLKVNLLVK